MKNKQTNKRNILSFFAIILFFISLPTFGQLAKWSPAGLTNGGPTPWMPAITDPSLTVGGLIRGAGVVTITTAPTGGWGGINWLGASNEDATFTVAANPGCTVSYSVFTLSYKKSNTGPLNGTLEYAIGASSTNYTVINTMSFPNYTTSTGVAITPISLSGVPDLQNVPSGTVIKFRIFPSAATTSVGSLFILGSAGMSIGGTIMTSTVINYAATIVQTAPVLCNGQAGAVLTASITGSTPPYTYSWMPAGGTSSIATGLAAGTYSCLVTSASSATTMGLYTITEPSAITPGIMAQNNVSCNGGTNGSATVSVSGGTPAYTYSWLPAGGTASVAGNLVAGTYTLNITDANNCTGSQTITITQPAALSSSISSQNNVTCNGGTNGSATVSVSGGTPTYSYSWLPSAGTTSVASNLLAGTYTLNITDANNCTKSQTVSITQPAVLSSSVSSQNNVTCNGGANGSATVIANGGTPAFTYSWLPAGGTSSVATGLAAGNYTLNIKDGNNCPRSQTVSIVQLASISASISAQNNVSCNGASNGSVAVAASGGAPAYTYSWLPAGGTSSTAINLAAGNYTLNITDANNCIGSQTISITQPAALSSSVSSQNNITCNGNSNGSVTVMANGGTPAYTYSWLPAGGTSSTATSLAVGIYTLSIKDANNCTKSQTVSITQPAALSSNISAQNNVSCNGGTNGSVSVSVNGGTPVYTYSWLPAGGSSSAAINLATGIYTLNVKDANNCTKSQTVSITQPIALSASISAQYNVSCNGGSNGSVTVMANGGTPVYTYSWLPAGGTSSAAINLAAGNYSLNIKDANNCTTSQTVMIIQPTALSLSLTAQNNVTCNGGSNGSATVSANGGTPAYIYSWLPAGGTASVSGNLTAGNYTLNLTDANNCTQSQTVSITQPAALSISATANSSVICNTSTVSLTGAGAITYTWTGGVINGTAFSPSATASYTVYGSNLNGCSGSAVISVTVNPSPTVTATSSKTMICTGQSATLSASGALTYSWTGGSTASVSVVSPTTTTAYTVTGKDANGCANTFTITQKVTSCTGISSVNEPDVQSITVIPNPNNGEFILKTTAEINLTLTNDLGQLLQTIHLSELNNYTQQINNLDNGIYFIMGTTGNIRINQKVVVTK